MNNNECQKYEIFEYQIGGRTLMLRTIDKRKVLKKILNPHQYNFYQYMQSLPNINSHYRLLKYLPICYRLLNYEVEYDENLDKISEVHMKIKQWFERIKDNGRNKDKKLQKYFMELENFSFGVHRLNLIDIKVGKMPKRTRNPWAVKNNIKVIGLLKTDEEGKASFSDRVETGGIIVDERFKDLLAVFFMNNQFRIRINLIEQAIDQIKNLSLIFRSFLGWKFNSVSVCFIYDEANPQVLKVKVIDFGRVQTNQIVEEYDSFLIAGLSGLTQFLIQIRNNLELHQLNVKHFHEEQQKQLEMIERGELIFCELTKEQLL